MDARSGGDSYRPEVGVKVRRGGPAGVCVRQDANNKEEMTVTPMAPRRFSRCLVIICFGLALLPTDAYPADLPTPEVTPGRVRDDLRGVCVVSSKEFRRTSRAMKRDAYAKYGITNPRPREYQIDHLIPLCLGGADTQENLWPQRYYDPPWDASAKDRLEQAICRSVCGRHYDLRHAQERMRDNWIDLYVEIFRQDLGSDQVICPISGHDSYDDDCEGDGEDDGMDSVYDMNGPSSGSLNGFSSKCRPESKPDVSPV